MDKKRRGLTIEEMEKTIGGTTGEANQYLDYLFQKYETTDIKILKGLVTTEEKKYWTYILNHKVGDPLKPYPD